MVFGRAGCPAFTIETNGRTGIRQIVLENFQQLLQYLCNRGSGSSV